MIVCIEGADMAGKSTLISRLVRDHGFEDWQENYRHLRGAQTYRYFLDLAPTTNNWVIDRGWMTEWLYSWIRHGETPTQGMLLLQLLREWSLTTHVSVVLHPPYKEWQDRATPLFSSPVDRDIKDRTVQECIRSYQGYAELKEHGFLRWVAHDDMSMIKVLQELSLAFIGRERLYLPHLGNLSHAPVVLVGDKTPGDSDKLPFIYEEQHRSNSGHYLLNALAVAVETRHWQDLALVNSTTAVQDLSLQKFWKLELDHALISNPRKRIVCLGKQAEERLKGLPVKTITVPHPQYWRRFKHSNFDEYVKILKTAIYEGKEHAC